ncbi:MAG: PTS system mannose/fructose/sorbose family transporter subunit IID [Candidatus Riflebacteria bacterium]|nr:PTS system mannose/fructose/sorbose family transporter subunit IID [Candidatus Riflebacteria bacterium]
MAERLSKFTLFKIAFRSFFLQASWNYRGLMNMGFLYAISPGLDLIYDDKSMLEAAYVRHSEYFNTNPYFASMVIGVILSLEERYSRGEISADVIHDAKEGLMTACAAIGDGLFWDSLRPFVAAVSLALASKNILFTPLIFLLLYNIPHLYFRFSGIYWGYTEGTAVIGKLRRFQFPKIRKVLRYATLIILAYLIPNHVNLHTTFFLNVRRDYFYILEKIVQGLGAISLTTLGVAACRASVDVLLISFLLMIFALVLYHWGILI